MNNPYPFHFALTPTTPLDVRENALRHIEETYGVRGRVEFVRAEPAFRLYRIVDGDAPAPKQESPTFDDMLDKARVKLDAGQRMVALAMLGHYFGNPS